MLHLLNLQDFVPFVDRITTQKTKLTGTMKRGKQTDMSFDVGIPVIVPVMDLYQNEKY